MMNNINGYSINNLYRTDKGILCQLLEISPHAPATCKVRVFFPNGKTAGIKSGLKLSLLVKL